MIWEQSESGMGVGRYQEDFLFFVSYECWKSSLPGEELLVKILAMKYEVLVLFFSMRMSKNVRSEQQQWSESVSMYVVFTGRKNVEESWVLHLLYLYPCKYVSLHSPRRNTAFPECRGFPKPALCYSPVYKKLLLHNVSKPVLKVASMGFF